MKVAKEIYEKSVTEERNASVSFKSDMEEGEIIIGTPTVTDATGELTLEGVSVNTEVLKINGILTPIGQAVTYIEKGGIAGSRYHIKIQGSTNQSQVIRGVTRLDVTPD